jgi:tetratricopeptide (TPR) repeat protein
MFDLKTFLPVDICKCKIRRTLWLLKKNMLPFVLLKLVIILVVFSHDAFSMNNLTNAGLVAYMQQDYKRALTFLSQAVKENPYDADALYYFANTLVKLHRVETAEKYYRKVIEISPDSVFAEYSLQALYDIHNYKTSIRLPYDSLLLKGSKLYTSENSYIHNIVENPPIIRWDKLTMPLKVYINEPHFKEHESYIRDAFDQWSDMSDGLVDYQVVTSVNNAHIVVHWRKNLLSDFKNDFYGYVAPEIEGNELIKYHIYLQEYGRDGKLLDPVRARAAAMHQVGHSLGITYHSDSEKDIMYVEPLEPRITRRDLSTLNLIYAFDPDISNFQEALEIKTKKEAEEEND